MTGPRTRLGALVAAACAAGLVAGCDGPNSVLIGQIGDSGASDDGTQAVGDGSRGSSGDDATGSGSSGADATTSSGSSGSSGASGASSSGSGGGSGSGAGDSSDGSDSGAASSSGSGGATDSGSSSSGSSGSSSGSSGGSSSSSSSGASSSSGSSGGQDSGGFTCDSGGPLALKSFWTLPTAAVPSSMAVDGQGDLYVTGIFNGTVMFGTTTLTGPTGVATGNIFLVKYSSAGAVVFAKSYGTPTGLYEYPTLAVDPAGDVFLGGVFTQTLTMGGGTTPLVAIAVDAFAAKISPTGTTLWADHFGYDEGPYSVLSIAVGPDGDPVIAGSAAGTIVIGGTTWPAPTSGNQPFIAKLDTTNGSVVWSNATGGDINSGEDIWVAVDSTGRVFVAARVESGGGAWGVEPDAGAATFDTLRAGFTSGGAILWGQFDYGGFAVSAGVDSADRFTVVEVGSQPIVVGGTTTFNQTANNTSLSLLFSPVDGTVLSGLSIGDTFTFPGCGAVDSHGNTLLTGTYWPEASPIPVGGLSIPGGGTGSNQPLFVAAMDGASHAVGVATLGVTDEAQPLAMAVDPLSDDVFVAATVPAAFTSSVGPVAAGSYLAVFSPDPCDDGAGPAGASTGNPSNHGDLGPDGGSPYVVVDAGPPAACPASATNAVNGAACPVARGCTYGGTTCCFCDPTPCGAAATTWTCQAVSGGGGGCPASPPSPGASCSSTSLQCDYCTAQGRLVAECTAGGWETGLAQLVCR
jgi:hypothetical protein